MTDRERLIALLKSNMKVLQAAGTSATATLRLADHLIANGVTFAKDTNVPTKGRWLIRSSGRGSETTNWAECSECHVCGSPQWKVCPVCEAKMESVEKHEPLKSCTDCENDGWDMPQCKHCNPGNDFMYFNRKKD